MLFQKLDIHEHEYGVDINITVVPLWTFDIKKIEFFKNCLLFVWKSSSQCKCMEILGYQVYRSCEIRDF